MAARGLLKFEGRSFGLFFLSQTCLMAILCLSLLSPAVTGEPTIGYSATSQQTQASTHAYSSTLEAAYDGSNSTSALIVVRGCDGESCTGSSFFEAEYVLSATTAPTSIELEWNIQAYDSFTPSNSITNFSIYDYSTTTWHVVNSVSGTLSGWEFVNITLSSAHMGQNHELRLRIGGFHNDVDTSSDELGIWVREFHLYSYGASSSDDTDQDGLVDDSDDCPNGETGWISNTSTDYDLDGCQDIGEDIDDDNDGVVDVEDVFPLNALEWADFDGDEVGDNADPDDDNDNVEDDVDVFPLNALEWADFDGDEVGDNADLDDDNDNVEDDVDVFPLNALEWADFDGDEVGDNADLDDDNDGYSDVEEEQMGTNSTDDSIFPPDFDLDYSSDFFDTDDDNDGISDADDACPRNLAKNWGVKESEIRYSHDSSKDFDSDGCRDADEDDDDDNDGKNDGIDVSCPRGGEINWDSKDVALDHDQDGCRDDSTEDLDDDNDNWNDTMELDCGTNPKDLSDYPRDSNQNGVCDALDPTSLSLSEDEGKNNDWISSLWQKGAIPIAVVGLVASTLTVISYILTFFKNIKYRREIQNRLYEGEKRFAEGEERFETLEDELDQLRSR
jgi:hypothetical protein